MHLQRVDVVTGAVLTEVEVDGEIAVYHPTTNRVVLLNSSASEIWRRMPITSVADLGSAVATHFGVSVDVAEQGVRAGVDLLLAEQLVVDIDAAVDAVGRVHG